MLSHTHTWLYITGVYIRSTYTRYSIDPYFSISFNSCNIKRLYISSFYYYYYYYQPLEAPLFWYVEKKYIEQNASIIGFESSVEWRIASRKLFRFTNQSNEKLNLSTVNRGTFE